ncbi:uncharacterized protein LOC142317812 [Lycorma delicatula]|uniref:uncharacterized protein LOC142317812 n=1 Tax=Lycorma delicatula TaxID=130591 RepID=UPI003F513BA7
MPLTQHSHQLFTDQLLNAAAYNTTDRVTETSTLLLDMVDHRCSKTYSMTCFKLDMIRLVERLGHVPDYQLLPSVSLVHANEFGIKELPVSLLSSLAKGNVSNDLDEFLSGRINNYLHSFTLSVKLLDQNTVSKAKEISEEILDGFSKDVQKGRKKGYGGAMWAAGTIAAIGIASLAAMAGKAMMTSMLALMLAAAGALRGGWGSGIGSGDKCAPHYITANGRNMDIQELMQKPADISGAVYRTVYEREP